MSTRIDLEHLLGVLRHEAVGADGLRRTLAAVAAGRRRRPRYARLALAGAMVLCAALMLRQGRPPASSGPVVIPLLEQIAAAQERVTRMHRVTLSRDSLEALDGGWPLSRREEWFDWPLYRREAPDEDCSLFIFDGQRHWEVYEHENRIVTRPAESAFHMPFGGFELEHLVASYEDRPDLTVTTDETAELDGRPCIRVEAVAPEPAGKMRLIAWADRETQLPFRTTVEIERRGAWRLSSETTRDYPPTIPRELFAYEPPAGWAVKEDAPHSVRREAPYPPRLTEPLAEVREGDAVWWLLAAEIRHDGTLYLLTTSSNAESLANYLALDWPGKPDAGRDSAGDPILTTARRMGYSSTPLPAELRDRFAGAGPRMVWWRASLPLAPILEQELTIGVAFRGETLFDDDGFPLWRIKDYRYVPVSVLVPVVDEVPEWYRALEPYSTPG